jgi:hypothetical protein
MGIHRTALSAVEQVARFHSEASRIRVQSRDAFFGIRSRFREKGGGRIALKERSKSIDGAPENVVFEEMRYEIGSSHY